MYDDDEKRKSEDDKKRKRADERLERWVRLNMEEMGEMSGDKKKNEDALAGEKKKKEDALVGDKKKNEDALAGEKKKKEDALAGDNDSEQFGNAQPLRAMELRWVSGALIGLNRYGPNINIIK